jgi:hypothetical protein
MGHIEIWGNIVPNLLVLAGRAIKEVSEKIPLAGFRLSDRVVFGLTTLSRESIGRSEQMVLGAMKAVLESAGARSEAIVLGTTMLKTEAPGARAEAVTITNV